MVRLKDPLLFLVGQYRIRFNSSMVRLKGTRRQASPGISWVSIPVWYDWKASIFALCLQAFHVSIPVWYDWKSSCTPGSTERWPVSIPVWYDWKRYWTQSKLIWCSFNSSMVRLKVCPLLLSRIIARMFQFQYGTIERVDELLSNYLISSVSIPVWYDWKISYESVLSAQMLFQFQYGTIESCAASSNHAAFCGFNSSMVRLKALLPYLPTFYYM